MNVRAGIGISRYREPSVTDSRAATAADGCLREGETRSGSASDTICETGIPSISPSRSKQADTTTASNLGYGNRTDIPYKRPRCRIREQGPVTAVKTRSLSKASVTSHSGRFDRVGKSRSGTGCHLRIALAPPPSAPIAAD